MDVRTLSEDKKISEYLNKLNELRKDGEVKSLYTKQRLDALKDNKLLSKEEKNIERAVLLEDLENSKRIIEQNKDKVKELSSEALSYSKKISSSFLKEKNTYVSGAIKALKEEIARLIIVLLSVYAYYQFLLLYSLYLILLL